MRRKHTGTVLLLTTLFSIMLVNPADSQLRQRSTHINYYDYDNNGRIDRAVIFLSNDVDSKTVRTASAVSFTVAGYQIKDEPLAHNIDNDGNGHPDGGNTVTLFLYENDKGRTDDVPPLTYNSATGELLSLTGILLPSLVDNSAKEYDKARPVILHISPRDINWDDSIDEIDVILSEPVMNSRGSIADGFRFTTGGFSFAPDGHSIKGNRIRLKMSEKVANTEIFEIAYQASDDSNVNGSGSSGTIRDISGNYLLSSQ